jgi:Mrp family chromosome partitioning ATPase
MGRTFEALRGAAHSDAAMPPLRLAPTADAEAAPDGEEAMPFIEVGPRRSSIEGSPEVLAFAPPPAPLVPQVTFRSMPAAPSRLAAELLTAHQPEHAVSAQYVRLLEAVTTTTAASGAKVLLFTGLRGVVGTTTVLLNVAITAARQGRGRIVVVDAQWRAPAVANRLGLEEVPGLREVLAGTMPLERALRTTEVPHLTALTAGVGVGDVVRFQAETLGSVLRRLRQQFDLVLLDAPAWDGRPDVVALAAAGDAALLVVPPDDADTVAVDDLCRHLPAQGVRLVGCVVAGRLAPGG